MPDYTIGIAERIASLPDSTATSNSVNRNYFQETSQSVVNTVNVAIAPAAPTSLNPTPQTTYATATDEISIDTFGVQETPIVITLLATIEDAGALAQYLIRSVPAYWFSNLAVSLNTLSDANKTIVANLEIGQQIAVTKSFPAGVVPQTVTEYLFVEGISHHITPETHIVTIYTGPASTYLQWLLGNYSVTTTRTNLVTNPNFETETTGWQALGTGTTISRITTDAYKGTACLQVSTGTVANSGAITLSSPASSRTPVTAGLPYYLSAWVKVPTGQPSCSLRLRTLEFQADGTQNASQVSSTVVVSDTDGWVRLSYADTPTSGATPTVTMSFRVEATTSAARTYLVDAVLFEQSSSLLPYFDGTYADTYTGYTLTYQAWDGVADTSTSTTVWGLNSSGTGSPLNDSTYGLD